MAGQPKQIGVDDISLAALFEAAWAVVGRKAYAFDQEDQDRLRCDLAIQIGEVRRRKELG